MTAYQGPEAMPPVCLQHMRQYGFGNYRLRQQYCQWLQSACPCDEITRCKRRGQCRVAAPAAAQSEVASTTQSNLQSSAPPAKPAFRASLDFKSLRENFDTVARNVRNRNSPADPGKVLELYDEWRKLYDEGGQIGQERNQNAKSMKVTDGSASVTNGDVFSAQQALQSLLEVPGV